MAVQLIDPPDLPVPELYHQVAVGTGTRTVHTAGQVARDATGAPVGPGDLAAQAEQVYLNVAAALAAAGAGFDDVVKLTAYLVDWRPERAGALVEGVQRAAERLGTDLRRPISLIGVVALGEPDLLIEVEAVAVLD
ncbi:RidA family protein [Kineococcus indalonis]|uniref:RidA family protein n=1 Tax=Kineococcus indalonis TaxID=2696566 RepID=UPI001411EA15|nr:RidA family protein [Kineococcus indalonis]NAZ88477.1 RidA family protein [Kineococcus indalonis]